MNRQQSNQKPFARLLACLTVALVLSVGGAAKEKTDFTGAEPTKSGKLAGRLLVAAPGMQDPRFVKTVIIMVHHNERGAMGVIVNRRVAAEVASMVLDRFVGKNQSIKYGRKVHVHYGGPVQPSLGIFVHSSDYTGQGTLTVNDRVSVTGGRDVLRAMAKGKGPTKGFLAMGYAGWGPGQLENEIRRKNWNIVRPDDKLVFDDDMQSKWKRAVDKRSVDL
jgi:putative transcriptional regulator